MGSANANGSVSSKVLHEGESEPQCHKLASISSSAVQHHMYSIHSDDVRLTRFVVTAASAGSTVIADQLVYLKALDRVSTHPSLNFILY